MVFLLDRQLNSSLFSLIKTCKGNFLEGQLLQSDKTCKIFSRIYIYIYIFLLLSIDQDGIKSVMMVHTGRVCRRNGHREDHGIKGNLSYTLVTGEVIQQLGALAGFSKKSGLESGSGTHIRQHTCLGLQSREASAILWSP